MRFLVILWVAFSFQSCGDHIKRRKQPKALKEVSADGYRLSVYDFVHFKPFLELTQPNEIRVINFWATWCKPCLAELPAFEELQAKYSERGVEVVLVSLDFPDQVTERLIPYIKDHNLKSRVVFLDDPYGDVWIPQVSEAWSGAIPATLIITSEEYRFYERSFEYAALEHELLSIADDLKK